MHAPDAFSQQYEDHLDGTYDCVDRIVLNAYFIMGQSGGGFRTWWRKLMGDDTTLDNNHLMRFAGRFSRRLHAYAKKHGIPLIHCKPGERKHELAQKYLPSDPAFRGVFCIFAARAQASVMEVQRSTKGVTNIKRKTPSPWVTQYSFHIMDPEWGHLTIKLCPHPPFNAQIILNGHEYVANQAKKKKLSFTKSDNCFTSISNAKDLAHIADTMREASSVGRLVKLCDRWIYSACLCFALDSTEQTTSGFHYCYSVYQTEYSRNLLFTRGRTMDQIFQSVIDRTRALLAIKTIKTIFGYQHRPFKRSHTGAQPQLEVVVERPVYDLTIFKVHFGKLTVKIYSKGERVLRVEAVAHNTIDLHCGRGINKFPHMVQSLRGIVERFLLVLRSVDVSFIDAGTLEQWPLPSRVGSTGVAGIDVNRPRIRAVIEAVIALSIKPHGFSASELGEKVMEIFHKNNTPYTSRHASYDLKKLRGKNLVHLREHSRSYEATGDGLRAMVAFLVLRDKVLSPLLAGVCTRHAVPKQQHQSPIDIHYDTMQSEMQKIFNIIGVAA